MNAEVHDFEVTRLVDLLGLSPHPEGGFFRETFRSPAMLDRGPDGAPRSASTAITFLLPAGTLSALHVIHEADEMWHHYGGDPLEIHTISPDGAHRVGILGGKVHADQKPQMLVPAGTLQAAVPLGPSYALCGCTVTPGFDFADFEMPPREALLRRFPQHQAVISKLTRG